VKLQKFGSNNVDQKSIAETFIAEKAIDGTCIAEAASPKCPISPFTNDMLFAIGGGTAGA